MSRCHVFSVMAHDRYWVKGASQFRYHGVVQWSADEPVEIDGDYLLAMTMLAVSSGTGLRGGIFDVLRMVLEADTKRAGAATTGDICPCVLVTADSVANRRDLELCLDEAPHETLIVAHKLGLRLDRAMSKARQLFK